jgi:hypothetical protein
MQQIMGSIIYYARAVNKTVLMALSNIASKQMKATEKALEKGAKLLDYLALNLDTKVQYYALDMVTNIHSDALYLMETKTQSCRCGNFFMGWIPRDGKPIKLSRAFHLNSSILQLIVASAAEAELGALFHNCQTGIIFCIILEDLGYHQPETPVYCNKVIAVGIAKNTSVKHPQSRLMEMRFFWICGKVAQNIYSLAWHPGQENLADYQNKYHMRCHHVIVRPWYLHVENSPCFLPWAQTSSALKGCVGTLDDGYLCKVPLPRAPRIPSPSLLVGCLQVDVVLAGSLRVDVLPAGSSRVDVLPAGSSQVDTCAAVSAHDKCDTCYLQVSRLDHTQV